MQKSEFLRMIEQNVCNINIPRSFLFRELLKILAFEYVILFFMCFLPLYGVLVLFFALIVYAFYYNIRFLFFWKKVGYSSFTLLMINLLFIAAVITPTFYLVRTIINYFFNISLYHIFY